MKLTFSSKAMGELSLLAKNRQINNNSNQSID